MPLPWIRFFHRLTDWLPSRSGPPSLSAKGKVRIHARPPGLQPWQDTDSGLQDWNSTGWADSHIADTWAPPPKPKTNAGPRVTPLASIREEFTIALGDIPTAPCDELQQRIRDSRSLRELWHLRAEVFKLIALNISEQEAQHRLSVLNRHFPTRTPTASPPARGHVAHRPWSAP